MENKQRKILLEKREGNRVIRNRKMILLLICFCFCLSACRTISDRQEVWPEIVQTEEYQKLAEIYNQEYRDSNYDYAVFLSEDEYTPFGDYLNWGVYANYTTLAKAEDGSVLVEYNGQLQYNPCTQAQYCLHLYGKYLHGTGTKEEFLAQTDNLLNSMEEDGALRYYFDYEYYAMPDQYFKSGWVSAMPVGHVLSVCARAFNLTEDEKYVEASRSALDFLQTPIKKGGY